MKKGRVAWEMLVGEEGIVFFDEADALAAFAALSRGLRAEGAADPRNPRHKITLVPIEVRLRRCTISAAPGRGRRYLNITACRGGTEPGVKAGAATGLREEAGDAAHSLRSRAGEQEGEEK